MKTIASIALICCACGNSKSAPSSTDASADADARADANTSVDAGLPDGNSSICSLVIDTPENGAVDVSPSFAWIMVRASCCVDSTSLTGVRLSSEDGDVPVGLEVQADDCMGFEGLPEKLEPLTTYTLFVPGGPSGLRGSQGETMVDDVQSTFITGP